MTRWVMEVSAPTGIWIWTRLKNTGLRVLVVHAASALADRVPAGKRSIDHRLRLLHDAVEVLLAAKALGVDLVDVLGARGTRGEPAAVASSTFDAADRRVVARRAVEYARIFSPASSVVRETRRATAARAAASAAAWPVASTRSLDGLAELARERRDRFRRDRVPCAR